MMLFCPYQESAEDLSGSTEQLQIANYSHKTDIQPWDLSPSETVNQWIDIENNKNNKWKKWLKFSLPTKIPKTEM